MHFTAPLLRPLSDDLLCCVYFQVYASNLAQSEALRQTRPSCPGHPTIPWIWWTATAMVRMFQKRSFECTATWFTSIVASSLLMAKMLRLFYYYHHSWVLLFFMRKWNDIGSHFSLAQMTVDSVKLQSAIALTICSDTVWLGWPALSEKRRNIQ